MGTALINNQMYADDLVILAPSHVGLDLSMLLSVCSDYGLEHYIKFNSAKSNIMIFCCKKFKDIHVPIVQWLSSQICNVCALLETSAKFGILVAMLATITIGYRTTSTAPLAAGRAIH